MPSKSRAGFDVNPQNINRNGRPKKEFAMTKILKDVMDEELVEYKGRKITGKEAVARKMLELAVQGDMPAIKYIYDRLEGTPRQQLDVLTTRPIVIAPGILPDDDIQENELETDD